MIAVISQWLARHVDDAELLEALDALGTDGLDHVQLEAVDELTVELREQRGRGEVEKTVRETLEALALGA